MCVKKIIIFDYIVFKFYILKNYIHFLSSNTKSISIYFLLTICLFFIVSCKQSKDDANDLFESVGSKHTNINFKNIVPVNQLTNSFVYEYVYDGGGVAVGDINNDGLDDIYLTSNLESNALYLNLGDLKFRNITEISKTKGNRGWTTGTNMVDINNDGLLDIYVCKSGPYEKAVLLANELYFNKGINEDGIPVFEEAAKSYGLDDTSNSIQSAFFDFDLDGDLDMYSMNHNPQTFGIGGRETFSPLGDKFYINEGGFYVDKTKEVGIYSNAISYGLGIGISDLNMDGWPDVYISNDYDEPDYMYINQKNGTFKEVIQEATNHIAQFSMGNDIADFDNDGFVDILTLDMVSEDNYGMKTSMASMNPEKFKRNIEAGNHYQYMYNVFLKHSTHIDSLGIPFLSDVAQMTGVANTDWSWAPLLADFDNDGLKDIFITNGIKKDFRNKDFFKFMQLYRKDNLDAMTNPKKLKYLLDKIPGRPHKNYFYKNNGGISFTNTSSEWLPNSSKTLSNGAAYADLDNDGDLDLIVNNVDEKAMILKNNSDRSNTNFISLEFKGLPKNTKGIGVKAIVYTTKGEQFFENYSVRGYQSSVPPKIHVGLGDSVSIDSLIVHWPGGEKQKLEISEINKSVIINFDGNNVNRNRPVQAKNKIFSIVNILNDLRHKENDFDDFSKQVLLPHKMSQFGPAIAVGDINSDGNDDIYFGQSTGISSILYIQNNQGKFTAHQTFNEDLAFEDVDAQFFDFDKDGDLDLYVASGGNEFPPDSPNYTDRLYENRSGKFIKRTDLMPQNLNISSSKIRIADYDNNGFPDIFVGGRHIPHNYPSPASSHILMNTNGSFKDVTEESAPELNDIGLVTDASWTDYDKDGDLDLCVVGEWMAPVFFKNDNNSFQKVISKSLDSLSGWYFSIKPLDIDKDGDDDYILGNLGENYKYKANHSEPFEVYYHDFDNNGKKDLVLGYYNFGELFPVRGRECSSQQVPNIKKITPTYDDFGKSTLVDLYGGNNLKASLHLSSYNFKSGILKNNGDGNFNFIEFPDIAQISSINDILLRDLDSDGDDDIILAGNLFTSEIETPRNDAGYGMVLINEGNFEFKPMNSYESGLFAPTDVKNLRFINIHEKPHILFGNNNSKINVFSIN